MQICKLTASDLRSCEVRNNSSEHLILYMVHVLAAYLVLCFFSRSFWNKGSMPSAMHLLKSESLAFICRSCSDSIQTSLHNSLKLIWPLINVKNKTKTFVFFSSRCSTCLFRKGYHIWDAYSRVGLTIEKYAIYLVGVLAPPNTVQSIASFWFALDDICSIQESHFKRHWNLYGDIWMKADNFSSSSQQEQSTAKSPKPNGTCITCSEE